MAFLLALVLGVSILLASIRWRRTRISDSRPTGSALPNNGESKMVGVPATASEATPPIEPLPNFDWKTTPSQKLMPFKPTYNITMAIQNSTPSELIVMDTNYLDRVTARRATLAEHGSVVHGVTPAGHAAVAELYAYLLGTYLPARYPSMFELITSTITPARGQQQPTKLFRNKVTNLAFPLHPPPSDPCEMLRVLGETVEDDMFLLLRDLNPDSEQEHRAVAFVCCHPAGFAPASKLGRRLAEIHGPVPAYGKIGASMERYFARLAVGRPVKRMNWSIQTHPRLYAPSGNHVHAGDEAKEEEISVDGIGQARFRVELQTLTRLPETQAILFSFKTYMYPLTDVKADGLGSQLAEAIEGLKTGNAPGMWVYKGGVRWGRAVCDYLRAQA